MHLLGQCYALAIEAPWCQLSSFLFDLLVWEAALCVFAGLHMVPCCLGAGLLHEVL